MNQWSPFDPTWYQEAFDKHTSTAEDLFRKDEIIKQGYVLNDSDGSKSSVFRNDAVLNNTFDENVLRDTLKEIYLSSNHVLTSINHDSIKFYQWTGTMSDTKAVANTAYCEIVLPTETFIIPGLRNKYKLSQFYRKWINITELYNNWDTFQWICLLFINKQIYSEYQLRIDDQETTIRFKYYDFWRKRNYPIQIYKFDTAYNCRIKISRRLLEENNWVIPSNYFTDDRIANRDKCIVYFNRINGSEIERIDKKTNVNIMGDNLEFINICNGFDLSNISRGNKDIIYNDSNEWIWLSIIQPRYLHEFPILLASDVVYRQYQPEYVSVYASDFGENKHTKAESNQVYINLNATLEEWNDGWKHTIRPMVLSDAYNENYGDPYIQILEELNSIKSDAVIAANILEEIRYCLKTYDEDQFLHLISELEFYITRIHDNQYTFLDSRYIELNQYYETRYEEFKSIIPDILEKKNKYIRFHKATGNENEFFTFMAPLINLPQELCNKFNVANIVNSIGTTKWDSVDHTNQFYFSHPVDVSDIIIFEYDNDKQCWYPNSDVKITRHFPDVYTFELDEDLTDRIFKAFIFYNTSFNISESNPKHVRPTASWDNDLQTYHIDNHTHYRNIYLEKFYWMAIRSVYRGKLQTHYRWELIEYIQDNQIYDRFNKLFLTSFEPYFRLGLANYSNSENYMFPLDYAIDKFNENLKTKFMGYDKVTNFELYLDKSVVDSYYNTIYDIDEDWNYNNRLIRRPRSTFDSFRLLPYLIEVQNNVNGISNILISSINQCIQDIKDRSYNIDSNIMESILVSLNELKSNAQLMYDSTVNLDKDIYSIDDVKHIKELIKKHIQLSNNLINTFNILFLNVSDNQKLVRKKEMLLSITNFFNNIFEGELREFALYQNEFDMEAFMLRTDNPEYFGEPTKDTNSFIGYINLFNTKWNDNVKDARNKLHQAFVELYYNYNPDKAYDYNELQDLYNRLCDIQNSLSEFKTWIFNQWGSDEPDDRLINRLEYVEDQISVLLDFVYRFKEKENIISGYIDYIRIKLLELTRANLSPAEDECMMGIDQTCDALYTHIGYVWSSNDQSGILTCLRVIKVTLEHWDEYVYGEESLVAKVSNTSSPDNGFESVINPINYQLERMVHYLESIESEYVPNTDLPSYALVYELTEAELVEGGLLNQTNDTIYSPGLGVFNITNSENGICNEVQLQNYRRTTFKNPMWQNNVFDSITDGCGMGITFKPTNVNSIKIKDNFIVKRFVDKVINLIYLIKRDMYDLNPFNNSTMEDTIKIISTMSNDWDYTLSIARDFISPNIISQCDNLVSVCNDAKASLEGLVEARSNCKLRELLEKLSQFIDETNVAAKNDSKYDSTYIYHEDRLITSYRNGKAYYGTGTSWNDGTELLSICQTIQYEIRLFYRKIIRDKDLHDTESMYYEILDIESTIENSLSHIFTARDLVSQQVEWIQNAHDQIGELTRDNWYNLNTVSVVVSGEGYKPGDIVRIIPELPKDTNGEIIHDNEEIILNDSLFIQVSVTNDEGGVVEAIPLIDYALPYQIYGNRNTETKFGDGTGLIVSIYTKQITSKDSTLLLDKDSVKPIPDKFDTNDLFVFKFQNIYDLPIQYEVFLGGKQIRDYIIRHLDNDNQSKIDCIYINANRVMQLEQSMIYEDAKNYFIYKMDEISLLNGGAGYNKDQIIKVSTDQVQLKFKVTEIDDTPYHGIKSVEPVVGLTEFSGSDPSSLEAFAVKDSLNNIDDEYTVTSYDELTEEEVPMTNTLDDYIFTRSHHDGSGNRNQDNEFNVDENISGELLGHRNDWNKSHIGIDGVIPLNEPKIYETDVRSSDQYQLIDTEYLHDDDPGTHDNLFDNYTPSLVNGDLLFTIPYDADPSLLYLDNSNLMLIHDGSPLAKALDNMRFNISNENLYVTQVQDEVYYIDEQNTTVNHVSPDLTVTSYSRLPKHLSEWNQASVGKSVLVKTDEKNNNHAMLYKVRTFVVSGYIVYEDPILADDHWTYFDINWNEVKCYPDLPSLSAQYPSDDWWNLSTFRLVKHKIDDGNIQRVVTPIAKPGSYIPDLSLDDLAVWNYTDKHWMDLNDGNWELTVRNNENEGYGFRLEYKSNIDAVLRLYLKKVPSVLQRLARLKAEASFKVHAYIKDEVDKLARYTKVNIGKHLRIRKLFPYEKKESYVLNNNETSICFKLNPYIHFRNELHAEDIVVFNKSTNKYENPLNPNLFELRIKDSKASNKGYETNTKIVQSIITSSGNGFYDGQVWGYNSAYGIHIFGNITTDFLHNGDILTFTPTHCVNPPKDDLVVEFKLYQNELQVTDARVMIEFQTVKELTIGDGWIHNVINPMAKLTDEFMLVFKNPPDVGSRYEVRLSKSPKVWTFTSSEVQIFPTYKIDEPLNSDSLYVLTEEGRLPSINPSTGKPSLYVQKTNTGCNVTLMDICKAYERIEIHKTSYPFRSVYTQRRIPEDGYVNIDGILNKPLSKKYYEFWVNGKLLDDEVTIITPTKLFFHGLKSRRNLEIIEINRNPNEFFSDAFLECRTNNIGRISPRWNFTTYLDSALEGNLEDNYTPTEQAMLLAPVWYQVPKGDQAYPDYPENQDTESDILVRMDDYEIAKLLNTPDAYQFLITDVPTLESIPLNTKALSFTQLGLAQITPEEMIEMLNEEWEDEINSNIISKHVVISENEWYGITVQLYDEEGNRVTNLNRAAYAIGDNSLLRINTETKNIRIVRNTIEYDLT